MLTRNVGWTFERGLMADYSTKLEERWMAGGECLLIRPIRPTDAAEHDAFFHRLSPEDIRLRFFAAVRELTPAQLGKFTRLDDDRDIAFIAVREETGQTVAVARLAREADPLVAEFAVIVQHDLQGRGLATHLLQRLLDWAPQHGVREVVGEILAENATMIDLARHLGFRLRCLPEDHQIIEARLSLASPPT
jgi:acetyltransferase